jgi:hypothetical protein
MSLGKVVYLTAIGATLYETVVAHYLSWSRTERDSLESQLRDHERLRSELLDQNPNAEARRYLERGGEFDRRAAWYAGEDISSQKASSVVTDLSDRVARLENYSITHRPPATL